MSERCTACLVSSCLMGLQTRYDGQSKLNETCATALKKAYWIPVCPEQLAGLSTPRPAAETVGGDGLDVLRGKAKVVDALGNDLSESYIKGANMVLSIAEQQNISTCFLKAGSPSCGVNSLMGVTTALLIQNNIQVIEWP